MLPRRIPARISSGLGFLLTIALLSSVAMAQTKVIKLRNGAITNTPPTAAAGAAQVNAVIGQPVSGLYLIQFVGPVEPEWRRELAGMGVRLQRFIPDDTFVAKVDGVPLAQIESLPYVFWAGEFNAASKVHSSVTEQVIANGGGESIQARLLLTPDATSIERAEIYQRLARLSGRTPSRFGDILNVEIPAGQLNAVLSSPAVLWVEGPARMQMSDEVSSKIVGGGFVSPFNTVHETDVQAAGFTGAGVTVAVADSGLNNGTAANMHPDLEGRVIDFFHYGELLDAADEHAHGTHVTGIVAGNGAVGEFDENGANYGLGVAPGSQIVAQRIFDGIGLYQPPESFEQLTRDAVRAGADIGSNSWGDDARGRYDLSAAEFDALVRDADFATEGDQPYILEFSAGNTGPAAGTINSPAVAKNVIATGASQNDRPEFFVYADGAEAMADFSSRGPAEDGRIKPDLVAPGTWISSAQSFSATGENAWAIISPFYQYQGGTSQAGPHVSGGAAVFVQWFRELNEGRTPSPAMVKAALINSAWDLDDGFGTRATPNNDEGWGRMDLPNLILGFARRMFTDQSVLLETGEVHEERFVVQGTEEPLVVTLAYTDVPGAPFAIPALVNDLDLEVVSPSGAIYVGNNFDVFGFSLAGPGETDTINNVEGLYLETPELGEWVVRVVARNVAVDARRDTESDVDQDFALVVSGDLPLPNTAVLLTDRTAYRAPDTIRFRLLDYDLLTETVADIELVSDSEPSGFLLTLDNVGVPGVFTGSVATAMAPAVVGDGILQLSHGDGITGEYFDESRGQVSTANAVADFEPPQLLLAAPTNRFGRAFVAVQSDELVGVRILYGPTAGDPQESMTGSTGVRVSHEIELTGLEPGVEYAYTIELTDIAGNSAVFENDGSFVAQPVPTVLLVNDYTEYPSDSFDEPIPVTAYTDSLNDAGVNFDVWEVSALGSPSLDVLSPYEIVIWRVNDSFWATGVDVIDPTEQLLIQQYLNGGGSFFMSSMEIASRLGNVPFRRDVLQIDEFVANSDPFGGACVDCNEDVGIESVEGQAGSGVAAGATATLDYSAFPFFDLSIIGIVIGPDLSDTFVPSLRSSGVFQNPEGAICAVSFPETGQDSAGRVVYFSFPLEAIPRDGTSNGRSAILGNALRFLVPGLNGHGAIALDRSAYTVPGRVVVEVGDTDLRGLGTVGITVHSPLDPGGVAVTLTETLQPGLFRGTFNLVSPATISGTASVRAADGDTIFARYVDASEGNTIREVSALIDTVPPIISNLILNPEYTEAFASWDTDEAADAIIEFGESPLLDGPTHRTVFSRRLATSHDLTLDETKPDQLYYYRVSSTDEAGNTTSVRTTSGGQPLTFTTLDPLLPPFFDDFEALNANDWTVVGPSESEREWTVGPPGGALASVFGIQSAHSPVNAWGSNLQGYPIGAVETLLVSPPIELDPSLGNRATLNFWHNYDFLPTSETAIIEGGELRLYTDSGAAPITLDAFAGDVTDGWEEKEYDFSPYIGKVVRVVWYYIYFDIGSEYRTGWLLDDVSVTMQQINPGTLLVTNNLAQATFNLSGPITRSAQPWSFLDTNAPPGSYSVTFNSVPYYTTPSPLNGTLTAGQTLSLVGNYTLNDSNANGISDAWESQYFGFVDPVPDLNADTDGDGVTDVNEFLTGTNPTNAASLLQLEDPLPMTNNVIQISWPTASGRAYQLQSTTNITDWQTRVDWYRSKGDVGTFQQLAPTNGSVIFRLRAQP